MKCPTLYQFRITNCFVLMNKYKRLETVKPLNDYRCPDEDKRYQSCTVLRMVLPW